MGRESAFKRWIADGHLSRMDRCVSFIEQALEGSAGRLKNLQSRSFLNQPSPPLYIADSSSFSGSIKTSILESHRNNCRVCIPASIFLEMNKIKLTNTWKWGCFVNYVCKDQWCLLDFDYEYTAFRTQYPKGNYDDAAISKIIIACAKNMHDSYPRLPCFIITSDRELKQVSSREGFIARTPAIAIPSINSEEKIIRSEAVKHLATRESKLYFRKS